MIPQKGKHVTYDIAVPLPCMYNIKNWKWVLRYLYTNVHSKSTHASQEVETSQCPPTDKQMRQAQGRDLGMLTNGVNTVCSFWGCIEAVHLELVHVSACVLPLIKHSNENFFWTENREESSQELFGNNELITWVQWFNHLCLVDGPP